jgi:Fe-S-cluster containining protein
MPVSRRLPKAVQNETRVSMILSRAQILFGSELKARLSEMIDNPAGFLDKNRAEQRRCSIAEAREKVFKTFQNFFRFLLPRM